MLRQHTNTLAILTGAFLCLCNLSLGSADAAPPLTPSSAAGDRHQLAIARMIAGLQAFCLRRQQAEMLAEQSADFGTPGLLITGAAMGMDRIRTNRAARRHRDAIDHAQGLDLLSAEYARKGPQPSRHDIDPV